ncbi:lasso peptide biosynthesis B2 protein [Marivita sp.]|uniref:lasso peptide biosynthesis B2 protein n=1 Tax=Marivita sp. TaxID=2003365 RepID=UPI0025C5F2A0|nr:lasso peptide biosynthesis B2 protein [Marivita sp.]
MRRIIDRAITLFRWFPILVSALFWVVVARLWLTFGTHRSLRPKVFERSLKEAQDIAAWRVGRVVWAVHHAARLVPRASCLTQGLAAQIMLARRGLPSTLHIGVKKDTETPFEAHAWLTFRGRIILGHRENLLARYSQLAEYGPTAA